MWMLYALLADHQTERASAPWRIPEPPILHLVGPQTALVVPGSSRFGDAALIQTPGWVTAPTGDVLRGVPATEVPVYVDGVRDHRVRIR